MVDGSGGGNNSNSMMDFNPTPLSSSTSGGANNSTTITENVAELQFGPDFEDIHSTWTLLYVLEWEVLSFIFIFYD